jgi:hypothetical protein
LVFACGPPGSAGDGAVDADVTGADEGTGPRCRAAFEPVLVGIDPCEPMICFRPRHALATDGERFLSVYSKNVAWWATETYGRVIDRTGLPLSDELDFSGRKAPPASEPSFTMASSEVTFAAPWNEGWLVLWEDRMTTYVFVAASAPDPMGVDRWRGFAWSGWRWVGAVPVAPAGMADSEDSALGGVAVAAGRDAVLAWTALGGEHPGRQSIAVGTLDESGSRTDDDRDVSSASALAPSGPAIASSGEVLLVVWVDQRQVDLNGDDRADTDWDLWGRLVSPDLATFRSGEFPIIPARYESSHPAATWAGDAFVLAWQDFRDGNLEIYTVRISPDGGMESPDGARRTDTAGASRNPSLAFREGELFLAWEEADAPWLETGGPGARVMLSRSLDGGRTWEPAAALTDEVGSSPEPKLAVSSSDVGLAWLQDAEPDVQVRFVRIECD